MATTLGPQRVPTAVVITAHEPEQLRASEHAELPDSVLLKQVSSSELFNAVNAAVSSGVIGARKLHGLAKTIEQRLRTAQHEDLATQPDALGQELVVLARAAAPHLDAADSAKRALEEAEREQSHPLDAAAIAQLREQLEQNDFAVMGTFKAVAPGLRAALSDSAYRHIEQAIGALDFKAALAALDAADANDVRAGSFAVRG